MSIQTLAWDHYHKITDYQGKYVQLQKTQRNRLRNVQTAYYMLHALIYKSHTTETIVKKT